MIVTALFDPLSILVLVIILTMGVVAFLWFRAGQSHFDELKGGLRVLRGFGLELHHQHPIRKRLESAPVVDLSFEEIAKIMAGNQHVERPAHELVRLQNKIAWIERFSQYAIHLGILGTVFALVSSDPTDLESFRASLPLALGTTFWGLVGAMVLSTIAGWTETVLDRARHHIRHALLNALDDISEPSSVSPRGKRHPLDLGKGSIDGGSPEHGSHNDARDDTIVGEEAPEMDDDEEG